MKRKELNALRAKRDELNAFAAWRAVAECLFVRSLAANNGNVFGREQFRQWLIYSRYLDKVNILVCEMQKYYCQRIIAAQEKQLANIDKHVYYKVKMYTHLRHYVKLATYEEKQAYLNKMMPLMITYRGVDFAQAFFIGAAVRDVIYLNADVLINEGIKFVEVNDFVKFNLSDLEGLKNSMGEAWYRKAVKLIHSILTSVATKVKGKTVLKLQ
ncbi:hypothetical protein HVZ88_25405 (plasmid) [Escherichia coli]|nr:hypothetical protein HVZ88_25405 [Escherichia coli]